MAKYSLGNIGFATSMCFFQFAHLKQNMELQCKRGRLSRLHYYGAISDKKHLKLNKKNDDGEFMSVGHDFCGASSYLPTEANCSASLDIDQMIKDYDKNCAHKIRSTSPTNWTSPGFSYEKLSF